MKDNKTFLAIIPARGGSKRLPRKNVLDLAGKPLIAWTIDAAKSSKYIDKTVVSSDSDEILQIANDLSVGVIKRPDYLANDTATSVAVTEHAINSVTEVFDFIILLQPTSPLRTAKHIDEAIELLLQKKADAVISVCETAHSPLWMNTLPEDGSLDNFITEDVKNKRSQDLPTYFRLNGAVYIIQIEQLLNEKSFFLNDNIFAYRMNKANSVDIDEEIDFEIASHLILSDMKKC